MLELIPHPDFPSVALTSIHVDVGRRRGGQLALRFYVEGDLEGVIWPNLEIAANRTDGLWQHSCFEAFVGFADEAAYCEFNLASSGAWAAYAFEGYRSGMRSVENAFNFGHWTFPPAKTEVFVTFPDLAAPRDWRLGLSAIIEAQDHTKSYWALRHPPGEPDFHNADCFAARVAAPDQP